MYFRCNLSNHCGILIGHLLAKRSKPYGTKIVKMIMDTGSNIQVCVQNTSHPSLDWHYAHSPLLTVLIMFYFWFFFLVECGKLPNCSMCETNSSKLKAPLCINLSVITTCWLRLSVQVLGDPEWKSNIVLCEQIMTLGFSDQWSLLL